MILSADIGTSNFKISLVDDCGNVTHLDRVEIPVLGEEDVREVDPNHWIKAFNTLFERIPDSLRFSIEAIVISGNGPSIVPVGRGGRPISNAVLWMDKRAKETSGELCSALGEFVPDNFFLSKVFWFKKKKPEIYNRTRFFISCPEFLSFYLTGNAYTLLPGDGFLPFYWDRDKLERAGLDGEKFPPFIKYRDLWGNYRGIPVICAGPDFLMSVLGSGSVESGIVCDRTGTSEGVNYCFNRDIEIDGIRTLPHMVDGMYTLAGLIPDSGQLIAAGNEVELINRFKSILDKYRNSGLSIKEVRVIGGDSSNEALNYEKYRASGTTLKVYGAGAELIGNAVLGYYILGRFKTLKEGCRKMVREVFCYEGAC